MNNQSQRGWVDSPIVVVILAIAIILGIIVASVTIANPWKVEWHRGCVVSDKDRTRDSDGTSDARVYTDNCGTFQVGDSLLDGNWSSADTFSSIKVGETYDFRTRGKRVPFFSMFPNIVEVTPR